MDHFSPLVLLRYLVGNPLAEIIQSAHTTYPGVFCIIHIYSDEHETSITPTEANSEFDHLRSQTQTAQTTVATIVPGSHHARIDAMCTQKRSTHQASFKGGVAVAQFHAFLNTGHVIT